jgi:hypothetical protein
MGNGLASADPARLEAAARAVPAPLRTELINGHRRLEDLVETFNASTQSPDRIFINREYITGWMGRAYGRGTELDELLMRVARAFRDAGDGQPPIPWAPVPPGAVRYLRDDALQRELDRWDDPLSVEFRPRDGGGYEVRGPDGEWYAVATAAPLGAVPLDRRQGVVDLGNPDFGLALGAAIIIGVTGGSTQPSSRPAPPDAYDYIHLDEDGYPVAGPGVTGHSATPGSLPPDGAPDYPVGNPYRPKLNPGGMSLGDARGDSIGLIAGGISEAGKYADEQHRNVFRTQTTYYVDGHGQRVAVVDAASIRYDNDTNEAIVRSGRLSTDERGRPELVPQPPDPITCLPVDESRTSFRIPLEEG